MKQLDLLSFDVLNETLNLMHKNQVKDQNIKPLKKPLESVSLSNLNKPPVKLNEPPEALKTAFRRYSNQMSQKTVDKRVSLSDTLSGK